MKKITKILVPLDFSDCSQNAFAFAIQLAQKINANLLLLNVITYDVSHLENTAFVLDEFDRQIEESKQQMQEIIQKTSLAVGLPDAASSIQFNIELGSTETTICNEAIKNQVDYIVMGTQGENSTMDKYLGSVTSNIVKDASCPVLVIPENTTFTNNIVMGYATNLSDADPFGIWKALKLFKPFEPKLKCVHFKAKDADNEARIQELAAYFADTTPDLDIDFHHLPLQDKVKDMNDFIEAQQINMLVMYKPKRSFFESIFRSSYTQNMAKHTNIPLLVFKARN